MIFGQLDGAHPYGFLDKAIQRCFDYCRETDLKALALGSYPIEDQDIFVNIVSYETGTSQDRSWEAHRKYLDIHVMLDGTETIEMAFISKMDQGTFDPDADNLPLTGTAQCGISLMPGDFLICYPEDGHKPGVCVSDPQVIKKAIFKVRI
ncbi:YhcH/YjgK/YiaL family protein [Eubacterium aggregans]|uniref:YhcH/YjgK/YiaL family protein n=1 Tax=Eubacterium aggregans TaxID=81409 RepID=A0A1H3ZD05_9FIRM|nr:YhcH/YjgK/YiaL family protein [Eubacterium aggregans]SEA21254.1 YhcH/YjgK/YiaL family protein [Eubacterium aggregans]